MVASNFEVERLPEPNLVFANGGETTDPRAGLLKYGPCPVTSEDIPDVVKVGIVGDSRSISMMEDLLREMRTGIQPRGKGRKRWKPPFPGLGIDSSLRFDYQILEHWKGRIQESVMDDLSEVQPREQRVEFAFRTIRNQIQRLCNLTPSPDVIFVTIPERIVDL